MLDFRILGPLEVWRDDQQIVITAPREKAFLAALLLRANRLVSADQLIDLLWGDGHIPPTARNTLHTWVWRLRRQLEPPQLLVTRPPGYLLRIEPIQLDLHRFEELLERGRAALTDRSPADAATLLGEALRLWRGDPLADIVAERLCHVDAARLRELFLQAVEARVAADLELGRHAELIGELRALVAEHPLREALHGQLMTALYRSGRQAEALAAFRQLRAALHDQLGVEPGSAVQQLHQAVLRAERTLDTPRQAPPGTPGRAVPAQLPADVSAFTGRVDLLCELDHLLDTIDQGMTAVVISTVAGTAGVGKTALALHWAHRVRSRFPDGQLYVNLHGYSDTPPTPPVHVLARFLHALGVSPGRVPLEPEEAADLYRTLLAERRMLILLDNARDADQVRPLLPGSAGCLVLVTSRDRLGGLVAREGARRLTVAVLTPAEAHDLLVRTVGERRLAAEPEAAAELADACAHLPLALRIAAANLVSHADRRIADYVSELRSGNRLAALSVDDDDRAAVRAAFDVSYRALTKDEQRTFRLVGLVPGADVTAETVAAMAQATPEQAELLLDRLATAHLVHEPVARRYSCHDLLRLYAAEHGEPDRVAALDRLFDFLLCTADAAANVLYPEKLRLAPPMPSGGHVVEFDDPAQALAWLDAERPNLVAAVRYAAERGPAPAAWLLADALRGYFYLRMYTMDWLTVAHAGLAAAQAAGEARGQAAAHISLADLDWRHTQHQSAIDHYTKALEISRRTGWVEAEAAVLGNLGTVYWQSGQLDRATEYYRLALAVNQRTGWLQGEAVNLCNLAVVHWQRGRLAEAADSHAESLRISRKIGSSGGEALALNNLGETYHLQGRLTEALDHLEQALVLHRRIGNRGSESETLRCLAAVHRDAGRLARAQELARAALTLARDTGNRRHELEALNTLATVHHRLGDYRRALDEHGQAVTLAAQANHRYGEAEALLGLAAAYHRLGRERHATADARRALVVAVTDGYRVLEGQVAHIRAAVHLDLGQLGPARQQAELALRIHGETGYRLGAARAHIVLAAVAAHRHDDEAVRAHRESARRLFTETGLATD